MNISFINLYGYFSISQNFPGLVFPLNNFIICLTYSFILLVYLEQWLITIFN